MDWSGRDTVSSNRENGGGANEDCKSAW